MHTPKSLRGASHHGKRRYPVPTQNTTATACGAGTKATNDWNAEARRAVKSRESTQEAFTLAMSAGRRFPGACGAILWRPDSASRSQVQIMAGWTPLRQ